MVDLDLNQFRSSANKLPYDESEGRELLGSVYYRETNDADAEYLYAPVFGRAQSDKGYAQGSIDHYLAYKFPNYNMDPNITNWILNLRNGLSEYTTETRGNQRWRNVTEEENAGRLNYRKDDYRDYMDGDLESSIYYNNKKRMLEINDGVRDPSQVMYQSKHENRNLQNQDISDGISGWPMTLVSNKSRVYKGGSWADKTYWQAAGNRRFLDEEKSSDMIGFRCAMDRLGSTRKNKSKR